MASGDELPLDTVRDMMQSNTNISKRDIFLKQKDKHFTV